ncbi:relaxase/mobilization nuclease domain-containing protein [Streptomyces sp. MS19]|uniref:relaxase/mobilization nuclease domain-containing protein n=1 Tax=Streptomyces sp. MS19 TaxID=3385972 RepID=UPI00399FA272
MIPRIHRRGRRTLGLLHYLYGPGTHEEHTDPHLVASFDGNAPDPGRDPSATLRQLQRLLDQPLENLDPGDRPDRHVWHLSVRNAAEDRVLTDETWADIARRMVAAAGIDPGGGEPACRWAAVRHAADHIHIVATLVREDGRKPRLHRDAARVQVAARQLETDLGLRQLHAGDGTAAKRPTSAERHKAGRHGRDRTAREELRAAVRRAAAGATGEEEFFDRLAAAGLIIRKRAAPSGDLLGYTVALPDDRNRNREPVLFSGSKLAPDLSLPRLRARWNPTSPSSRTGNATPGGRMASSRAAARRRSATAAWEALLIIEHADAPVAAAYVAATGEILDALAATSAPRTRRDLHEAAAAFERASRSHIRAEHAHARALRQAARDLAYGGHALSRGEDGATTAMVIDTLYFLAIAAAHWHARHQHAQQAAAARAAAGHLRTAYRTAARAPLEAMRRRGRQLPISDQQAFAVTVRQAVPDLAEPILAEPGWLALAATLAEAQAAGHDPTVLLRDAARHRELDTADSLSEVLAWRLRRAAGLPAATTVPLTSSRDRPQADEPSADRSDAKRRTP